MATTMPTGATLIAPESLTARSLEARRAAAPVDRQALAAEIARAIASEPPPPKPQA